MKNKWPVIIALLVIFIATATYLFLTAKPGTLTGQPIAGSDTKTDQVVTVSIERQTEEGDTYVIEKNIPTVTGSVSPLVLAKINNSLRESIDSIVKDFKDEIKDIPIADVPDSEKESAKHSLSISIGKTINTDNKFLSVHLTDYSYISGSAHPLTATVSYNFDLKDGHLLTFKDLFDSGTNYLGTIASIAKIKLKKQIAATIAGNIDPNPNNVATATDAGAPDMDMTPVDESTLNSVFFEEGADPREENYSVYFIDKEGIKFVFGQYQVAPYVFGEQEVLITYAELQSVLNKSFSYGLERAQAQIQAELQASSTNPNLH